MDSLSKIPGVPLYVQIREALREDITKGLLKPGQKIPSEEELAKRYHVSRMTVRQGIADLINEGLLYRRRGIGTFVAQLRITRDYTKLTSFFEDMLERGLHPSSRLLNLKVIPAGPKIAKALALEKGEPVICIERLRLAADQPIAIHCAYVPQKLCPELLKEDLESQSLYMLFESYGFKLKRAVQRIEARQANQFQAHLLEVEEGAPLLYMERITFADDGTPVEYVEGYNRGDRYACTIVLSR